MRMWKVTRPTIDLREVYDTCASSAKNVNERRRLGALADQVVEAAATYADKAQSGTLHTFPSPYDLGEVTQEELVKAYENRLADGPGRRFYDAIKMLPDNGICPFCDLRDVTTLDHVLPKASFPILSVTPDNLVGCCGDCNHSKLQAVPSDQNNTYVHPYFDDTTVHKWLVGEVIEATSSSPVVRFKTQSVSEWSASFNMRVAHHFRSLGLAELYSRRAGREMSGIRYSLMTLHSAGGADSVKEHLSREADSRSRHRRNSWQAATYESLANSPWFCEVGISLIGIASDA